MIQPTLPWDYSLPSFPCQQIPGKGNLNACSSKCGPWASRISITWSLLERLNFRSTCILTRPPDLYAPDSLRNIELKEVRVVCKLNQVHCVSSDLKEMNSRCAYTHSVFLFVQGLLAMCSWGKCGQNSDGGEHCPDLVSWFLGNNLTWNIVTLKVICCLPEI